MGVVIGGRTFYPGTHLKLRSISYNVGYVAASAVRLQWDATTPQDLMILQGWDERTYYGRMFGGIPVPSVTGATGKILFTTEGFVAGSFYAVTMGFKKDIVQT
jgi:hypothetical protein